MSRLMILCTFCLLVLIATASAEMMSVGFSGAEIRNSPDFGGRVIVDAARYYPVNVQGMSEEYFQVVDYRNRRGYVHKSLLVDRPAVVITAGKVNVRAGAGTGHDVAFQLSRGETALLTDRTEGWVAITTADGRQGWVADFLVWGE